MRVRYRIPFACLLLVSGGMNIAQTPNYADLQVELSIAQNELEALELQFDSSDPRLMESLEQLANGHIALQQFDDAHLVLDRAIQIARRAEGLYTPTQLPLLHKKIANYTERGDWERARTYSEHLLWLYRNKTPLTDKLVSDLMGLADLHLSGLVEDQSIYQSIHLKAAMEANRLALLVANTIWEEHDVRIVPVLYQMLKQHHLQTVAVDRAGHTGYALRELVPGSRWVFDKDATLRKHYFNGLGLLKQIHNIYSVPANENPEALAMLELYRADWQVMYSRRENALADYNNAYMGLLAAGVSPENLNDYFEIPEVIPVNTFFPSVELALLARTATVSNSFSEQELRQSSTVALKFEEWSYTFPNVRAPIVGTSGDEATDGFALFSFNLTGLNEVSRWMGNKYRSGIGVVDQAELLELQLANPAAEAAILHKLHALRFRPRLLNGAPAEASGTLMYLLAEQ